VKINDLLNDDDTDSFDWRDFVGIPYFEIPMESLTEAVIHTEIAEIIHGITLPFKNSIPSLDGTTLIFKVTDLNIHETSNEFIILGKTISSGDIVVWIKKRYENKKDMEIFKKELGPLLHHELTHYFQLQKTTFRMNKCAANMQQYFSMQHEIMAYANQAAKMVTKVQFEEIISKSKFDPNQSMEEIIQMYLSEPLFKNGKGFIWIYFIWFKRSDPIRKKFVKYFFEYLSKSS